MMLFKTNAKCMGCATSILKALESVAPAAEFEFHLDTPEHNLTYTGATDSAELGERIVKAIEGAGFKAERVQ